ncbi:protein OSCP1a [Cynoglossus semilaevis]|uniref:protein OSCP1a n=1 Tax=Cynoglossus semilaevis TaxID=244447 RepID=UPI0007DCA7B4|nr:protein OSCP1-like [Cynoglossus semilaevis]
MSVRTLPLVFINLGGEMLYILDQRLRTHDTADDSSERGVWSENDRKRVISDIVATMFSSAFMDEVVKPQQLYSHRTMKAVLTRLAHVSIMRLNPGSMDRLYELMIMAFKYQVFLCPRPKDLLLITYNHIDTIREFIKDTPAVVNQVDETHRKIMEVYSSTSEAEFQLLRQTLLVFFQDMRVRVAFFLKARVQNPDGRFVLPTSGPVPHGSEVPGMFRMFDRKGREVKKRHFSTGGSYSSSVRQGCFQLRGDRVITLGLNMYSVNHLEETLTQKTSSVQKNQPPNLLAKEELNLLSRLMGSMEPENQSKTETRFQISLFNTDEEEEQAVDYSPAEAESLSGIVKIQATQDEQAATELARIVTQFTDEQEEHPEVNSCSKGDDLLAMMDDL